MNSWTDIGLIVAIVIGLISAASLPMVSVNAVSSESLRLTQARHQDPGTWALVSEGRLDAWTASPPLAVESRVAAAAKVGIQQFDPRAATASRH